MGDVAMIVIAIVVAVMATACNITCVIVVWMEVHDVFAESLTETYPYDDPAQPLP